MPQASFYYSLMHDPGSLKSNAFNMNTNTIDSNLLNSSQSGDVSLDDNYSMPSPPLSPRTMSHSVLHHNLQRSVAHHRESAPPKYLLINPSSMLVDKAWTNDMTPRRYYRSTHGFLSQYRFETGSSNKPSRNSYLTRSKTTYPQTTANMAGRLRGQQRIGRKQRLVVRRLPHDATEDNYHDQEDEGTVDRDYVSSPSYKKPTSPPRRLKKPYHHSHNSHSASNSVPIASASAVAAAPTYQPNESWQKLPDYSPSLSTLSPDNAKALRIEWKGSPMDLSTDPLKDKLHPAELVLAQILRLPCDLYIDSKRRLFLEKVYRLKQGKPFRRTDAQKACKIDVNKASRLFAAFEKVGWLDESHFVKYL